MKLNLRMLFMFLFAVLRVLYSENPADLVSKPDVRPGLLISIGIQDCAELISLHCGGKYLVHALVKDRESLDEIRIELLKSGLYGRITGELNNLKTLPYADNTVNVIIAGESDGLIAEEMMRVLAPYGSVFKKEGELYIRSDKPFPKEMDVWREYAHDEANTYMSRDTLAGPLESIRWLAGDKYYSGRYVSPHVVSAGGRVFFKYHDRGFKGCVEARDAFNGRFLWSTAKTEGISDFLADDDRLYIFHGGKLKALDAATGKHLFDFELPGRAVWQIFHLDKDSGILVFASKGENWAAGFDSATGKRLWQVSGLIKTWSGAHGVVGNGVFYYTSEIKTGEGENAKREYTVKSADLKTGAPGKEITGIFGENDNAPTVAMFLNGKLIVSAANPEIKARGGCRAYVVDPETGKVLWNAVTNSGVIRGGGFFFINGLFYAQKGETLVGYDPETGEIKDEMKPDKKNKWHVNHGCDAMVATVNYAIGARMHFIDPVKKEVFQYTVTRTPCKDSVRVANGLTYFPRHTCACTDPMIGNIAISGESALVEGFNPEEYTPEMEIANPKPQIPNKSQNLNSKKQTEEWRTYRGNSFRGAYTPSEISTNQKEVWRAEIGNSATAPVIADGKVFAASSGEHTVYALNAENGEKVWSFTAGGIVDSPPTFYNGLVLFGARNGWVYCLTSEKGEMVWKFRAAPGDRRIIIQEQLESIWPVFGSVLVEKGVGYACAGRHADIDSGLFMFAFRPETGELIWKKNVKNIDHATEFSISSRLKGAGAVNDILRSDGVNVYMAGDFQKVAFNLQTGERSSQPEKEDLSSIQKALAEGKNGIVFEREAEDGGGAPVSRFDGPGFVLNWLVLGPFPKTKEWMDADLFADRGGEAALRITPEMKAGYEKADGTKAEASVGPCNGSPSNRLVSPRHLDNKSRDEYSYAFCVIRSETEGLFRGFYGSSGEEKIWINGTAVADRRYYRSIFQQAMDSFPVPLKKGLNTVLIKMGAGRQGWPFYFALTDLPAKPIISTSNDMLLPPSHRALGGTKGDPTNASIIWVYHPDPEKAGMPFHHHEERFDITSDWGFGADAFSFDGYKIFGVGREHDSEKRWKLAVYGRTGWDRKLWFTDIDDSVDRLKGVITAGNTVIVSLGGTYKKEETAEVKGRILLYSAEDGSKIKEVSLDCVPQWDGMAAAYGKLFISAENGTIYCFSREK